MQETFIVPRGAGEIVRGMEGKTLTGWLLRVVGGRGIFSRALLPLPDDLLVLA